MNKITPISQSKLIFKIFYSIVIFWFLINAVIFITIKYLSIVLHFTPVNIISIGVIFVFSLLFGLFFTFYYSQIIKLIAINKKTKYFKIDDSLLKFKSELNIFEQIMYAFFIIIVFTALTIFNEIINIYIHSFLGNDASLIGSLLFLVFSFWFLLKIFTSQKFLFYKMGVYKK